MSGNGWRVEATWYEQKKGQREHEKGVAKNTTTAIATTSTLPISTITYPSLFQGIFPAAFQFTALSVISCFGNIRKRSTTP